MSNSCRDSILIKIGSINHRVDGTFLAHITENVAIDLWLADLGLHNPEVDLELMARYWQILSTSEQKRAALMGTQRSREFILTRGILRELLSSYSASSPQDLAIVVSSNGKPYLDPTGLETKISFSVSHGQNLALYGIMPNTHSNNGNHFGVVGIDLELQHRDLATSKINKLVKRYFLPQEQEIWFRHLLKDLQNYNLNANNNLTKVCFLRSWTAKEAYAKATGLGLAHTLNHLDTSPWLANALEQLRVLNWQDHDSLWLNLGFDLPDLQLIPPDDAGNDARKLSGIYNEGLNQSLNQDLAYSVRNLSPLFSKISRSDCIGAVCWRQAQQI